MSVVKYDVPSELREAFDPLLQRWLILLPGWCETLYVDFDDESKSLARTGTEHEYRRATITIGPGWLTSNERDNIILHELCHILNGPMVRQFNWFIKQHIEDEKMRQQLEEEWRDRLEGCTSDMEFAFRRMDNRGELK